jgi:hypothetical protein
LTIRGAREQVVHAAPAAPPQNSFQSGELFFSAAHIGHTKSVLTQHVVKPNTGVGVLVQQVGQRGKRVLPVVGEVHTVLLEVGAVTPVEKSGSQGVNVVRVNAFKSGQPVGGHHPTRAGADQQQVLGAWLKR